MFYALIMKLNPACGYDDENIDYKLQDYGFNKHETNLGSLFIKKGHNLDSFEILHTPNKIIFGNPIYNNTGKVITEKELLQNQFTLSNIIGEYVYIERKKKYIAIYRDPTGQIPCYFVANKEYIIFSSSIYILQELTKAKLSLNIKFLAKFVIEGFRYSRETPFNEIKEICPGEFGAIVGNKIEIKKWFKPIYNYSLYNENFHTKNIIKAIEGEIERINNEKAKNILLHFSGGTDSTILLHALKNNISKNKKIYAVNIYHPLVSSSNETFFAEKICKKLSVPLIKFNMDEALPFSPYDKLETLPNKPHCGFAQLYMNQKIQKIADDLDAIQINGHGGDHIFASSPILSGLFDSIFDFKFDEAKLFLFEACKFHRIPYFKMIKNNFKSIFTQNIKSPNPFFNNEFYRSVLKKNDKKHNFFKLGKSLYLRPGKYEQIKQIMIAISDISSDLINPGFPVKYPLISQSVINAGLSIPTYKLLLNQYERYPYRKAASEKYKTNDVWRRNKGQTSGVLQLGFNKNKSTIYEILMEGFFIKNGLIDKEILKYNINLYSEGINPQGSRAVSSLYSAELFINFWKNSQKVL